MARLINFLGRKAELIFIVTNISLEASQTPYTMRIPIPDHLRNKNLRIQIDYGTDSTYTIYYGKYRGYSRPSLGTLAGGYGMKEFDFLATDDLYMEFRHNQTTAQVIVYVDVYAYVLD